MADSKSVDGGFLKGGGAPAFTIKIPDGQEPQPLLPTRKVLVMVGHRWQAVTEAEARAAQAELLNNTITDSNVQLIDAILSRFCLREFHGVRFMPIKPELAGKLQWIEIPKETT